MFRIINIENNVRRHGTLNERIAFLHSRFWKYSSYQSEIVKIGYEMEIIVVIPGNNIPSQLHSPHHTCELYPYYKATNICSVSAYLQQAKDFCITHMSRIWKQHRSIILKSISHSTKSINVKNKSKPKATSKYKLISISVV